MSPWGGSTARDCGSMQTNETKKARNNNTNNNNKKQRHTKEESEEEEEEEKEKDATTNTQTKETFLRLRPALPDWFNSIQFQPHLMQFITRTRFISAGSIPIQRDSSPPVPFFPLIGRYLSNFIVIDS